MRFAKAALKVARKRLSRYRTKFPRHDFEWPQLVACLLLRQFLRLDYRGVEQMLLEHKELRMVLDLRQRVPDHTVLCRAIGHIRLKEIERLLDETVDCMVRLRRRPGRPPKRKTVIPDSTGLRWDSASRSYWRKVRRNSRFRRWPQWSVTIDRKTHVILSQVADVGPRSDHCEFESLIQQAQRRRPSDDLLGDAGYDSDKNLRLCEEDWQLQPIIKIKMGRPSQGGAISSERRRQLHKRFPKRRYGQRWQVESAFSAHKRRFGDVLRSRTRANRRREQLLRGILHNCAVLRPSRM